MKKIYFILTSIFTLLCLQVVAQTPYYYNGGVVTSVTSWGLNPDGSGGNPNNFGDDDQIFNIVNGGGTATLTANWSVSGLNSKIVIGDGVSPFNLSTSTFTVTGVVDISDFGTFTVQSTTSPFTVGTLASGSTVDYALDGAQVVRTGTYHHLTLSNATAARAKTATGGTVTVNGTLNVTTNNVLTMGTNVLNGTLSSIIGDGSISTSNESAAPIPSGKTWTQTVTYGSSNTQPVSGGTYENLTFSGSTTVKNVGGDITVNNLLNVATGSTMVMTTFVLSGLASPPTGTGAITTTHTATASPIPSGKTWTQTVSYSAAGAQTVRAGTYQNLTISGGGSNVKTADGNISVIGTLTTGASTILDMATFDLLTATTITNNTSGTIRTQSTSATPIPAGLTIAGTFLYNSTSPQFIVHGTYNALNVSGGDRTYSTVDSVRITSTWTTGSGAQTFTGSSIALRGGTQAITITGQTALVFNNLSVSIAGVKTFSNTGIDITINGDLHIPGTTTYTLAMGTNRLLLGGGHTFSGTGTLTTTHISTTEPVPNGMVWPFIVNFSATVAQSVSTGTYSTLVISGTGNATPTGNITVTDSLAVTAGVLVMGTNSILGAIAGSGGGTGIGGLAAGAISTANTTATPLPANRVWPMSITYDALANQTIVDGTYLAGLSLSGGSNVIKTATGNLTIGTTLTVAASTILDMSTFTLGATTYTNSGTIRTQNTSSTPLSVGLTVAGTVEYNGAGSQTVVHGTYTNLDISGGVRDLSGLGDITVVGILTATTGTINGGTSNVRLTGGNVNISLGAAGAFNNFRVVGTGTRTVVAGTGPLTVNGELEVHSVRTLALNDNQLLGTITSNIGTGTITTTRATAALAPGITWTISVSYSGTTQEVSGGTYRRLLLAGTLTKTATGDISVSDTLSIVSPLDMSTFQLTGALTRVLGTATLTTANEDPTAPIPAGKTWLSTTVFYNSANMQTVVNGQYLILDLTGGNRTLSPTDTIKVSGTFTAGSGTYTSAGSTVALNGTTQTINGGGSGTIFNNFAITSGTTKTVAINGFNVNGELSIVSTATLTMGAFAMGGTAPTATGMGLITTTCATAPLPSGTNWTPTVSYLGTAQQLSGGTFRRLLLGGSLIKTAIGNVSVSDTLNIGSPLDMSTFQLTGTITRLLGTATLTTANEDPTAPIPAGKTWLSTTVFYNSANMQTVVNGQYLILDLTGGNRTLSSTDSIKVSGTFTAGAGTYTPGTSNFVLNGTTQTINGGGSGTIFNNFAITSGTTKTVAVNGFNVNGELSIVSTATLTMGAFAMGGTAPTATGMGLITTTCATAPLPSGTNWTPTVSYLGTTQQLSGGTFRRLLLGGTLIKTAIGNVSVSDTLNIGSPLNMSTFQLTGTITSLLGTATLTTANEDPTAPIPAGKTWLSTTVFYNSANMQTVVNGQYLILDLSGGNRTLSSTDSIKVSGTFTAGAGTYTPGTSNFVLNGTATQSFVSGGQTFHNFNIMSGSTKTVTINGFSLNGTLHIVSGATLVMGALPIGGTPTATSGTGNITTTCATAAVPSGVTWNPSISYGGTTQQLIGGTYRRLLIAGTLIKTATGDVSVSDSFNIGSPVDMTTFQLTGTMTSLVGTATLTTANEDVTAPIPAGKTWLSTTVFYNSANMQTVVRGQYVALNLSGGNRTLSSTDTVRVSGTFTAGSGTYTSTGSTLALNGGAQTANMGGNTFNNFAVTLAGIKTIAGNGFNVDGELNVVTGATLAMVTFQLGGTISSTSGTGTITTACVATNPLPNGETWNPAVTYNAATQNVANGIYNNTLTIATTGTKTALGNITANGILAVTATLSMGTNLLDGTITSTSGTGTIITQNTAAAPIPEGETWTPNVTYSSTSAQTVVSGTYNLALNVAGGNRTFSNLATITVGGTFTANTGAAVYTTTGTIFNFSATVAQALTIQANFPFETVMFTGAHTATPSAAMAVATAIQIASGTTVNMGTNALTGATLTAFGTGNLRTQNTTATPIPTGRTWTFRLTFDANGNQTVPVATYNGGLYGTGTSSLRIKTLAGNIVVADTLSITTTFATLALGANTLTLNGVINPAQTGTITGGLTSNIIIGSGSADAGTLNMLQTSTTTRSLNNLTVSRNTGGTALTLGNEVRLINVLTLTDGTLASNGNLVFVSTGVSTSAQIDAVTGTGAVSGNVVVQRFIDGQPVATNVRWRFLASPVNTSNGIDDNWQRQIYITGAGTGGTLCPTLTPHTNGIDPTPSNSPSFYTRDAATDTWVPLANTNATELVTGVGYRVFYRGSRTQNCATVFTDSPPAPVDTTLVATGTLATGTQIISGSNIATRYSLAGNPFQATIDWESASIIRSNISSTISTFRPNTTNGAYAYYTVGVGGTNGMTQYMTAGTGFWIQTVSAGAATVSIGEAAKVVSQGGYGFFKTAPVEDKVLRIKLFETGQAEYLDEAIVSERAGSDWAYNAGEEAQKLGFTTGLMQLQVPNASTKYAICVVPGFEGANNRINIDAKTVVGSNYSLNFSGITSFDPTLGFTLYDNYTGTNQDLRTNAVYNFTTPDAASIVATRFYIIFTPNAVPLPVKMISFKGERTAQNETALNWQTASEEGSDRFEIERSVDAKSFTLIGATKAAKYSSKTVRYAFIDNSPALNEVNYYRLKQYDLNGTFTYTNIVSVSYKKADAQLTSSDIIMYPVPASNTLTVEVKNIDKLNNPTLMVYDMFGKELSLPTVYENGKWQIETSALKAGVYFVHINNNGSTTQLKVLKD